MNSLKVEFNWNEFVRHKVDSMRMRLTVLVVSQPSQVVRARFFVWWSTSSNRSVLQSKCTIQRVYQWRRVNHPAVWRLNQVTSDPPSSDPKILVATLYPNVNRTKHKTNTQNSSWAQCRNNFQNCLKVRNRLNIVRAKRRVIGIVREEWRP